MPIAGRQLDARSPRSALAAGVRVGCLTLGCLVVTLVRVGAYGPSAPVTTTRYAPLWAGTAGLVAARADLVTRQAAGGWPAWPGGAPLGPGTDDPARVEALRERLAASGDLATDLVTGTVFDRRLEEAVRTFQARHGLVPDGVVGRATHAALAVPITQRRRQIDVNIARREALPTSLGERFLLVNLAACELAAIESGEQVLAMKVVDGKPTTPSPELATRATHIVLNPYWNVPGSIAAGELAPREAAAPGHLVALGIRVFRQPGGVDELDPALLDWSAVARGEERLYLRQDPGSRNSLGRLSVQMPNDENVCLHDTPEQGVFARSVRAMSHGCVRLEDAPRLALYLLRGDARWTADTLASAIASGVQREIQLPAPVPVFLVYWTAWTAADGSLQFRPDIYHRDRMR